VKTVCKSLFTNCIAGMLTVVAVATSFAQSAPEPAVVISVAPVKEQMTDINYLVDASGFGQAKFLIKSQIRYLTGGIDSKRPSGALLYFEGDNPEPRTVIFLPVKDLDDLLDTVSNMAEVDDEDEIIKILPPNGETLYAMEKGSHVFITMSEDALADLPKDPASMLGEMPSKYNSIALALTQTKSTLRSLTLKSKSRLWKMLTKSSSECWPTKSHTRWRWNSPSRASRVQRSLKATPDLPMHPRHVSPGS